MPAWVLSGFLPHKDMHGVGLMSGSKFAVGVNDCLFLCVRPGVDSRHREPLLDKLKKVDG